MWLTHFSCTFHLSCTLPSPTGRILGLNICLPQDTTFLSPVTALPQHKLYRPFPYFLIVITQREENYNREKLKTQYFCSNFPGSTLDFYTLLLYCCHGARASLLPTTVILFIPQLLTIQIKEVIISPHYNPRPISFVFISCFRIDLIPGGQRSLVSISGKTPTSK